VRESEFVCECAFGLGEGRTYHDDVIGGTALVFLTGGNANGDRIGPISLHQRSDDEQHKTNTTTRLARRPAHRHGAKHGRRQRVR
jgi:hypothetical protein